MPHSMSPLFASEPEKHARTTGGEVGKVWHESSFPPVRVQDHFKRNDIRAP
jgi:hypothetical protein